ncbi:MAG: hypothetical protein AB4290_10200 [Spirulina sp.]
MKLGANLTLFTLITVVAVAAQPAKAGTLNLDWTSTLESSTNVTDATNVLGAPDGSTARFLSEFPTTGTFSGFGDGSISQTDSSSLATLLGISEATLSEADFIAFEHNGTANAAFESATWTFDDGSNSIQIFHDFNNPSTNNGIVALGNIANEDYADFFGFTNPFPGGDNPFLLFDLDGLDLASDDFTVTINATGSGNTSPDIDSMGIIVAVPEPSFVGVFSLGAFIFGVRSAIARRKKRLTQT